jgi:signal transduction histidine kinase
MTLVPNHEELEHALARAKSEIATLNQLLAVHEDAAVQETVRAARLLADLELANTALHESAAALEEQLHESEVLQEELETSNEELHAQTEALTESNARLLAASEEAARARADAEHANRAKSDFLTAMSHDLRTPLNAISGYADLIDAGARGPVTDAQAEDLRRIRRASQHLLSLINDILTYSRLAAAQTTFAIDEVLVDDLLRLASTMIEPQSVLKGVTFVREPCDPSAAMLGDHDKVLQIVLNLLSNALKFTRPGGTIGLGSSLAQAHVRVRVHDTGRGIPADHLASIFEPFVQVGRRLNGPEEGSGLGLAISSALARGMNGSLDVESVHGAGSTFTLTLRRAARGDVRVQ